jgi:hypothetical protein
MHRLLIGLICAFSCLSVSWGEDEKGMVDTLIIHSPYNKGKFFIFEKDGKIWSCVKPNPDQDNSLDAKELNTGDLKFVRNIARRIVAELNRSYFEHDFDAKIEYGAASSITFEYVRNGKNAFQYKIDCESDRLTDTLKSAKYTQFILQEISRKRPKDVRIFSPPDDMPSEVDIQPWRPPNLNK